MKNKNCAHFVLEMCTIRFADSTCNPVSIFILLNYRHTSSENVQKKMKKIIYFRFPNKTTEQDTLNSEYFSLAVPFPSLTDSGQFPL